MALFCSVAAKSLWLQRSGVWLMSPLVRGEYAFERHESGGLLYLPS
jgi:hypothetical protein